MRAGSIPERLAPVVMSSSFIAGISHRYFCPRYLSDVLPPKTAANERGTFIM